MSMELERFIAEKDRIIREQERIIAEQSEKIGVLEGYLMRKYTVEGRVHTSSQTEAPPVFYIIPKPPKEGAPRNVTVRNHRRYKTYPPFQGEMSFESSDKKGFSLDVGIQDEDVSKSISLSRQKKSRGSFQRLPLCDNRDPQTTETLPPISPTKETLPFHQFHAGTLSVDMSPTCKPEIDYVTH